MAKVTVNETVSRSATFENFTNDIPTAITRCFQFLEERRFEEAHVIIEQILNVEPNNTDVHIANFLYHFKLTCVQNVACNHRYIDDYINSVFYKRIANGVQTNLSLQLNSMLNMAKSQQVERSKFHWFVFLVFIFSSIIVYVVISYVFFYRGPFEVIVILLLLGVMALNRYISTNQKIKLLKSEKSNITFTK